MRSGSSTEPSELTSPRAPRNRGRPVRQELVDLGRRHGDAGALEEHPPLVLGHRRGGRGDGDRELGALVEHVDAVVTDHPRCTGHHGSAVEHRTRADHHGVVVPADVEQHLGLRAEHRAALALAGDERDVDRRGLLQERPEQGTPEVVEVQPVALTRQPGELPGTVQGGELQEPGVLLGTDAEPVLRVGERAPGQLPTHPVAGVASGHRADAEPHAAGRRRQRTARGTGSRGELGGDRVTQLELQPHPRALRGGRMLVVTGEAGEVVPPVRGRRSRRVRTWAGVRGEGRGRGR
ncbi:hypothetical protein Q9Q99_00340 [Curtobacterium flaccumfaciens]|nr:hypothetical protein Q9Q99_00340 [Curtobacterium flaccumfaciens]